MKNFKIQVDDHKADFFKQLLDHLDFASYEEVDGFNEPRIYPAADFEIRSAKDKAAIAMEKMTRTVSPSSLGDEKGKKKLDAMSDIRSVMSQIDKIRNKSK